MWGRNNVSLLLIITGAHTPRADLKCSEDTKNKPRQDSVDPVEIQVQFARGLRAVAYTDAAATSLKGCLQITLRAKGGSRFPYLNLM